MGHSAGQRTDGPIPPRPRAAGGNMRPCPWRRGAHVQPEIVVETVQAPNAAALLARWGEELARLGHERLRRDAQ